MSAQIFKTRPPLGFTKPPWRFTPPNPADPQSTGYVSAPSAHTHIAQVYRLSDGPATDEATANAVLIAVAPAMYMCLRAVRAYYTAMWSGDAKKKAPPFLRAITDLLDAIEPKEPHES